jgi:DNA-binding NarL/FixJ family response regulator
VYRNALFAQGVRSVLDRESAVQIVGMEDDVAKATKAVRTLHPEVILVEEPMESGVAWPFLEWANASRIVTFSLNHAYATVYNPHRTAAADPVDLVKAIQGAGGHRPLPGPERQDGAAPDRR